MKPVRVALRVCPLLRSEIEKESEIRVTADGLNRQIILNDKARHRFTFNHVFSKESTQDEVYMTSVNDLIQRLFSGKQIMHLKCLDHRIFFLSIIRR